MDEREQAQRIVADLRGLVERSMISLGVAATLELRRSTPVDTGWAQSNWIPSIGRHRENPVGRRTPAGVRAATAAQAQGIERVRAYKLGRRGRKVFITNSVPYISATNDVHRPGYVQRAIVSVAARTAVGAA